MSAYKSAKSTSTGGSRNNGVYHLYVGGLGCQVDSDQVKAYFERYMEIDYVKMILNKDGQPRGCCNIRFAQEPPQELLEKIIATRHTLGDRTLEAKPYQHNPQVLLQDRQEENARSIMIFNLHPDVRTEDLKKALEKEFGPVSKADVVVESNGKSKCFGHATFVNENIATFAKKTQKLKIKGYNCTIKEKKDRNDVKYSKESCGANSAYSCAGYSNDHYPYGLDASNQSMMSDQISAHHSGKSLQSFPTINSGMNDKGKQSTGFAPAHSVGSNHDQYRKGVAPYQHQPQTPQDDPYAGVSFEDMGMGGFYIPNGCEQVANGMNRPPAAHYPHGGSAPYSTQMNLPKTVPKMGGYPGHFPAQNGWCPSQFGYPNPAQQIGHHGGSPMMHPHDFQGDLHHPPYPVPMAGHYPHPHYQGYPGYPGHPEHPSMMISPEYPAPIHDGSNMRKSTGMASLGNDSRARTANSISNMSDFPQTSNGAYGKHLQTPKELKKQNNLDSLMQTPRDQNQQMAGSSMNVGACSSFRQGAINMHPNQNQIGPQNPNIKPVKHDSSSDSLDQLRGCIGGGSSTKPTVSVGQQTCPFATPEPKPKSQGLLSQLKEYCVWGAKKCDGKAPAKK